MRLREIRVINEDSDGISFDLDGSGFSNTSSGSLAEDEDSESEEDSDEMSEYELNSQQPEEEKKQFDYDFSKEEFLNPILVKGPDGALKLGTEKKDKLQVSPTQLFHI